MVKHRVCDRCLWRPEERVGFLGLELQMFVSGHLREEPPVLLTRESALRPLSCVSCCQSGESVKGWGSSLSWFLELDPICSVVFDCSDLGSSEASALGFLTFCAHVDWFVN